MHHSYADSQLLPWQRQCGLPISTYFSAVKLRWLMDNVPAVREEAAAGLYSFLTPVTVRKIDRHPRAVYTRLGRCLFGTVDAWLIWNLTGGVNGGKHVTDVTNASRTMLMNIGTRQWDAELCQ